MKNSLLLQRNIIALVDSGADQNCLREGLIPSKFYEKTSEQLQSANGAKLQIKYKLPKAYVCNSGYCFKNSFILVKDISNETEWKGSYIIYHIYILKRIYKTIWIYKAI